MAPRGSQDVFRLRIELVDVEPLIWRQVLVPASFRLSKVAKVLESAMGWSGYHLHQFTVGDERYGPVEDLDDDEDLLDESTVTAAQALNVQRFQFDYDFGDRWEHQVEIEDRSQTDDAPKFAVCLDGANACPPEDVGGTDGYRRFLIAISDPANEEHSELLEWAGGPFDPAAFSAAEVNARLQRIR